MTFGWFTHRNVILACLLYNNIRVKALLHAIKRNTMWNVEGVNFIQKFSNMLIVLIVVELLCGRRPQSGALLVSKFGNLLVPEILVLNSAYLRPSVRPYWGGQTGGRTKATRLRGGECHRFLAGNCAVIFGNERSSWREFERPSSLLKKRFL